jgi:enoyl-CoA hydratase
VIRHLAQPQIRASMKDEMIYQTFVNRSDDLAEMRAARTEERPPKYTGS